MKKTLVLLAVAAFSASASAACYTVLGPKGQVLSESPNAPVDMRYQLHQTVPYKYGRGATMVFGVADGRCGEEVDRYYDIEPTKVAYQQRSRVKRRGLRAPRADRE